MHKWVSSIVAKFWARRGERTADIREFEELRRVQDFEEKLFRLHGLGLTNGQFDGNYSLEETLQLFRRRKSAVLNVKLSLLSGIRIYLLDVRQPSLDYHMHDRKCCLRSSDFTSSQVRCISRPDNASSREIFHGIFQ